MFLLNKFTLLNIFSKDIIKFIKNPILLDMNNNDWGKTMSVCNEIIHKEIFEFSGIQCIKPETVENYDLILKHNNKNIKIQSKLRQINGRKSINFLTSRSRTKQYSSNEFDYAMISLIDIGKYDNKSKQNIVNWTFHLIPTNKLIKKNSNYCVSYIPYNLLEKYKIDDFKCIKSILFS